MRRTHLWLGALSLACLTGAARAQVFTNHSKLLAAGSVTRVLDVPPLNFPRLWERKLNVGPSGGGYAWCSRENPNPAPNDPLSFVLGPWGNPLGVTPVEEFTGGSNPPVPQMPLWCTADTGTVPLNVETLP